MDITANQARIMFQYRTRMSNYWDNFKGGLEKPKCKICREIETVDSQPHFMNCSVVKKRLNVKVDDLHTLFLLNASLV